MDFRWALGGQGVTGESAVCDISKKRGEGVVVFYGIRIILVIMALGTPNGCTHPYLGNIAYPVGRIDGIIFFELKPTLMRSL